MGTRRGRPPLPLGGIGTISSYKRPGGGWISRARVRDYDGVVRHVGKTGKSKSAAETALKEAVRVRHVSRTGDITPDTTVDVLAETYWAAKKREWGVNTRRNYRDRLDRNILPSLGRLTVRELTTGTIDAHIKAITTANGAGTAKLVKTIISGMCAMATRNDAIAHNPVASVETIKNTKPPKDKRVFTVDEAREMRGKVHLDPQAIEWDLADLIDFWFVTGLRMAESLAVEWPDIDMENMTVSVGEKIVVRETGKGLYILRLTEEQIISQKLKRRTLDLPKWYVEILKQRKDRAKSEVVFTSPKGLLRDPSNTNKTIGVVLGNAGFGWATSHTFRRTLLTWMDEAGLSARAAADQAGHAKVSMTQDEYYGRNRGNTGAAKMMDEFIKLNDTMAV